jgi:hypothetical protein
MRVLFIGGSLDRANMMVQKESTVYYVAKKSENSHLGEILPIETETYYRETLKSTDGKEFFLFRHETLNSGDVMGMLLKFYKQED